VTGDPLGPFGALFVFVGFVASLGIITRTKTALEKRMVYAK